MRKSNKFKWIIIFLRLSSYAIHTNMMYSFFTFTSTSYVLLFNSFFVYASECEIMHIFLTTTLKDPLIIDLFTPHTYYSLIPCKCSIGSCSKTSTHTYIMTGKRKHGFYVNSTFIKIPLYLQLMCLIRKNDP